MSKETDNKAVVGRWFTEFWGKNVNLSVVDEIAGDGNDVRRETADGANHALEKPSRGVRPHMQVRHLGDGEPIELGGQSLRKGEKVILWYISANRDESVFADADVFDVGRENARRHVAFGHGIHRCVGARLAEVQLCTLIEEIVARGIRIEPQGPAERLPSPFLHGFTHMPVRIVAG